MLKSDSNRRIHPFLIITKNQFQQLVEKSSRDPWFRMIKQAEMLLEKDYNVSDIIERSLNLRDVMGAAALLYITDFQNKEKYINIILDGLDKWPDLFIHMKEHWPLPNVNKWLYTVPQSGAFFQSVIALDVIYEELESELVLKYEKLLGEVAEWYWEVHRGWGTATLGVRAIWSTYTNDEKRLDISLKEYRDQYFQYINSDGVFKDSHEYAMARYGGERTAKFGFAHVAEFTGVDRSYYNNPILSSFYEWLYSASMTPFNSFVTFGDSGFGRHFRTFYPNSTVYAASRFSKLASAYAAKRMLQSQDIPGDLLSYCICEGPLPEPKNPESRVWPLSTAVFYDNDSSTDALMGTIWSPIVDDQGHAHFDVNAIHIAGYSEEMLLNSGYAGYGNGPKGFTWNYIHSSAESSNTVLINGQNHVSCTGGGINEALLCNNFDYASAYSSNIYEVNKVRTSEHYRNFCFAKPSEDVPGYFVIFDEVNTDTEAEINVVLHPASERMCEVSINEEYDWDVQKRKSTGAGLSVFLATEPECGVEIKAGVLAGWDESFVGKYLYSTYKSNNGIKNIVTILFPYDEAHSKAHMSRIKGEGYSGARIAFTKGITDIVLEASDEGSQTYDKIRFCGKAVFYRKGKDVANFYFVRKGREFFDEDSRVGFSSEDIVSIFINGRQGQVISRGTDMVVYHSDMSNVFINEQELPIISSGKGWVKVYIPSGTHNIRF
jgi:hypothetical protein